MNTTVTKTVVDPAKQDLDVVLADLEENAASLLSNIQTVRRLQEDGNFKFVSKTTRNELLHSLIESAGVVEETTKVAFRGLKKIKRERLTEERSDALLGARLMSPSDITLVR